MFLSSARVQRGSATTWGPCQEWSGAEAEWQSGSLAEAGRPTRLQPGARVGVRRTCKGVAGCVRRWPCPLNGFGGRSGVDGLGDCCALPVLFFSEIHALPGLLASASLPFLLHFSSLLIYNVSVDWRCTSPFFPVIFNLWETREQVEGHAFVDDVDIWFYLFIGF